jgi:hypothetical protein
MIGASQLAVVGCTVWVVLVLQNIRTFMKTMLVRTILNNIKCGHMDDGRACSSGRPTFNHFC